MFIGKQHCVICDIDGTLAHEKLNADGTPVRGWYDYELVHTDVFDTTIGSMIYGLHCDFNATIVFLTARVFESFDVTKKWLESYMYTYGLEYGHDYVLYTRSEDDDSCDSVYKVNMIKNTIIPTHGEVIVAFEDRPLVVDSLHDIGVKVFAVSDQRVKF